MVTGEGRGLRQVGYFDCAGGGQVVVDGEVAFIAHMHAPEGTTLVDVSDPRNPRRLAALEVPKLVDITSEMRPVPFATFQVAGVDGAPQPPFTGCHQPAEEVRSTEIPVAWFAHGLRIVDIADPRRPQEVASFMPPVPPGHTRVSSNDVFVDHRGLIYLIDRGRGLHILERVP